MKLSTSLRFFAIILLTTTLFDLNAQEVCNNGLDDDGDNLIDLNDIVDCSCQSTSIGQMESLIPNPSFEDHVCVPENFSGLE